MPSPPVTLNSRIRRVCVTAFSYAIMTSRDGPCTNQCPIRHIRIVTGVLLYTAYCAIFLPLCPDNRQNHPDAGRCHCLCRRRCFPCAEKQHRRPRTRRRAGSGRKSGSKFLFSSVCFFSVSICLPVCHFLPEDSSVHYRRFTPDFQLITIYLYLKFQ